MRTSLAILVVAFLSVCGGHYWLGAQSPAAAGTAALVMRLNNRGAAYLEQYDYAKAAAEFEKAVALNPSFVPSRVNLGIAFYYANNHPAASTQLEEALKLAPGEPHAHFLLGMIATKANRSQQAVEHFQAILARHPEDVMTIYGLGLTYMRARDYARAVENFQRVVVAEPHNASAIYNLAMADLRTGNSDEGEKLMARFQKMRAEGAGAAMGSQYMEEGPFAQAITRYDVWPLDSEENKVRFTDVTRQAGVVFQHGGKGVSPLGRTIAAAGYSREWAVNELVPSFGSGAVFFDADGDGKLDIFLANCAPGGHAKNTLLHNNGDATFTGVTARAGLAAEGCAMGVAVGDYNDDSFPDLYVAGYGANRLYRNDGKGHFRDVTAEAGVGGGAGKWSLSAIFVDYDHDGDLDLYVTNFVDLAAPPRRDSFVFPDDLPAQPNVLYRNNGNGTFSDVTVEAGVAGGGKSTAAIPLDYNNSRDIDLLVNRLDAPPQVFSNNRNGTFADVAARLKLAAASRALGPAAADSNRDSWMDFFFPSPDGARVGLLLESRAGEGFAAIPLSTAGTLATGAAGWSSTFLDYDNDGALEILAIADRPYLFKQSVQNGFADVTAAAGLDAVAFSAARTAAVADFDGDGDLDLLITNSGGRPVLLRNDGGSRNHFLKVKLEGLRDNKTGIGAKVEVRAGSLSQKAEANGGAGYLAQGGGELLFGLGRRTAVESVNIVWPTGVLQAELDPKVDTIVVVKELDRKGTSCPILYAWNGVRYAFVTDFLGGSAFGYQLAPGVWSTPDTDEYVLVEPHQMKPRNGYYSVKMVNQLEEVIFFDRAKLVVVDHPAGVRVFPNERLKEEPPYPEFRIYATKDSRPPVRAMDDHGRDITALLRDVDRRYPDGFRPLPFKGYAGEHSMVLDFGDLSAAKRVLLLLTAWIDYADSTSNLAASQAGVKLVPPFVQVPDAQGRWTTIIPDMGFPAGLPKTMTVDLTGKFLSRDYRVKITTSMRIYWDQVLVDTSDGDVPVRVRSLEAARATLGWAGYPAEFSPDGKKPFAYDYDARKIASPWKDHAGRYTRFGVVTPLLRASDDKYVITHHADEITLDFDARSLPPLPAGWARSFLVYADGFGKDMDLNSADADTVGPLPYHGMPVVLKPGSFPSDAGHRRYHRMWNTRRIGE